MNQSIEYINTSADYAGVVLATYLIQEIDRNQNVVWFISGGSSIPIAQMAIQSIVFQRLSKIKIVIVDEKFKRSNQARTNWSQLVKGNTYLQQTVKPILHAKLTIEECLEWADYAIGQFGIGEGYYTGGIQSGSVAVTNRALAAYYQHGDFKHITVTTKLISILDLVFINSFGESKIELVVHFTNSQANVHDEPTQALKSARKSIIATDTIF